MICYKIFFLWIGNCVFIWCGLDHEFHKWAPKACAVTHYVWLVPWKAECHILTQRVLVTSYCERDQGQHWLMQWFVIWRHRAITWSNVDLSSARSGDIHPSAISLEISQPPASTITYLKFHWNLPRANEFKQMQCSINIKLKIYLISFSRIYCIVIRDVFVESNKNNRKHMPPWWWYTDNR